MAGSSTPMVPQAPALGINTINNASGTTAVSLVTAGVNGALIESITLATGPTTAPGGTYTVAIEIYDGTSKTGVIDYVTLIDAVDLIQYQRNFSINLAANAEIRAQMRTALASGATVIGTVTGRTY